MNVPSKANSLQTYQTLLYSRALHPELFELRGRRVLRQGSYELEAWVMDGQHVLRFEHGSVCATELVTDQDSGLPEIGVVSAFLCAGERDIDHGFKNAAGDAVISKYMTTVQTEQLSENLFKATFEELSDHAVEQEAMMHRYEDETGACLSILDLQAFAREIHVQAYHLIASGGVVLRTQTIFEHA